jgi:apolipoprotein N-acyltransferase
MADLGTGRQLRLKSPVVSALLGLVLVLSLSDQEWRSAAIASLGLAVFQLPDDRSADTPWLRCARWGLLVAAAALLTWWLVDTF